MIKFQIISLFPDYFTSALKQGLLGQAIKNQHLQVNFVNPRDFTNKPSKRVDDAPFGGGDGMVMSYQPLESALCSLAEKGHVICPSPQGRLLNFKIAKRLSQLTCITLICGRYAGIDHRFIQDYADEEISIGDYILNGGEAASLVLLESIFRFLPGALGNHISATNESFEHEGLLEGPQWTRPQNIKNHKIPRGMFSGNHADIEKLRRQISLILTYKKRKELIDLKSSLKRQELAQACKELAKLSNEELKACDLALEDLKLDPALSE